MSHAQPMPAGLGGAVTAPVRPFRRSQSAPRRRRVHLLVRLVKRALPYALALGAPALAVTWLLSAPAFAFAAVDFEASPRVTGAWVRESLAPLSGENLLLLSLAAVTARVAEHPWVAEVAIRKVLPDRLEVAVTERRPAAVLARGAARFWVERNGHLIAPLTGQETGEGLPQIRETYAAGSREVPGGAVVVPTVPKALALLAEVAEARPEWARALTAIEVIGEDDFALHTAALPFPIAVRAGDVTAKSRALSRLLPEIERRYAGLDRADLRYSRRIVLVPKTITVSDRRFPVNRSL